MGTTVRIKDEDKEKLEKLQAMAALTAGSKVSQEEIIGKLVQEALSRGEDFLMENFGKRLPLSDKEFEKVLSLSTDWGVKTSEEDIDTYLYGRSRPQHKRK